jgi:hypothetical protein
LARQRLTQEKSQHDRNYGGELPRTPAADDTSYRSRFMNRHRPILSAPAGLSCLGFRLNRDQLAAFSTLGPVKSCYNCCDLS